MANYHPHFIISFTDQSERCSSDRKPSQVFQTGVIWWVLFTAIVSRNAFIFESNYFHGMSLTVEEIILKGKIFTKIWDFERKTSATGPCWEFFARIDFREWKEKKLQINWLQKQKEERKKTHFGINFARMTKYEPFAKKNFSEFEKNSEIAKFSSWNILLLVRNWISLW